MQYKPRQKFQIYFSAYRLAANHVHSEDGDRRAVHLGTYDTEEDAAKAYDSAARFLKLPTAKLNFPSEDIAPKDPLEMRGHKKRKSILGYYGIYQKRRMYVARIMIGRVVYRSPKSLPTPEEAARYYDGMARFFGEAHFLNFPNESIVPIDPTP